MGQNSNPCDTEPVVLNNDFSLNLWVKGLKLGQNDRIYRYHFYQHYSQITVHYMKCRQKYRKILGVDSNLHNANVATIHRFQL